MTIYLIAIAIAIISGLLMKSTLKKQYGVYYNGLMAIVTIFISGLRHVMVGHDTLQFYNAFSVLGNRPWSELSVTTHYEWGYKIINKLLYTISSNPQFFIFATSTFITIAFTVFIYRYSNGYILSWVIYLTWSFPNSQNLLRQSIAVSILLFGIQFLIKKKYKKYMLVIAFATLFHRSAIFAIIIAFIVRIKNKFIAIVACVVGTCLGIAILYLPFVNARIRYSNYFVSEQYGTADLFGNLFKLLISIVVLLFVCFCFRKDFSIKQLMRDKMGESVGTLSDNSLIVINIVWVIVGLLAININIFDRLFLYFEYFMLITLPRACMRLSKKNRRIIVPLMIILFITMLICAIKYTNYAGISPYRFFWQQYETMRLR